MLWTPLSLYSLEMKMVSSGNFFWYFYHFQLVRIMFLAEKSQMLPVFSMRLWPFFWRISTWLDPHIPLMRSRCCTQHSTFRIIYWSNCYVIKVFSVTSGNWILFFQQMIMKLGYSLGSYLFGKTLFSWLTWKLAVENTLFKNLFYRVVIVG